MKEIEREKDRERESEKRKERGVGGGAVNYQGFVNPNPADYARNAL